MRFKDESGGSWYPLPLLKDRQSILDAAALAFRATGAWQTADR